MSHTTAEPMLTSAGVAFTVCVDSIKRACVISNDALAKLSKLKSIDSDPMTTFRAFEATITGVARRLVAANVPGTPLLILPQFFR
ncbi:DUF1488 family protein [Noviherbaspirillum sp.]|uniref:DUF1488 family protein n=1 Tax=Noviherbaspirillum sp. TaxID=1926288 RepID=UPI0025D225B2|nr:DUF1488 family protein [Noviherbaspirillum sp.]HJV83031.1 DUF1488 family protein [Noviherbaspirillum sp.]